MLRCQQVNRNEIGIQIAVCVEESLIVGATEQGRGCRAEETGMRNSKREDAEPNGNAPMKQLQIAGREVLA
jgi:hypothetical protein